MEPLRARVRRPPVRSRQKLADPDASATDQPEGPVAILDLQRKAGNASVARSIQRDDLVGGMSSASGTSAPGSVPGLSQPTSRQTQGRKDVDDVLADFSQAGFRNVHDWSGATEKEKLTLIDKATDLSLFWVGPDDEYALEACWRSFGTTFATVVQANRMLWNRSIIRGVDPENIGQTKGLSAQFKKDISAAAEKNLDANEDRVVKEFEDFGLMPPWDLVRASQPDRGKVDSGPSASATPTAVDDKLIEQAKLAKVVQHHDRMLDELVKAKVGVALAPFDPSHRPPPGQDIDLGDGRGTWDVVNDQWTKIATEVALILNAWPVLYAAHANGSLDVVAAATGPTPTTAGDIAPSSAAGRNDGLEAVRSQLTGVLTAIKKARDADLDPRDLLPVQNGLYSGAITASSGTRPAEAVLAPILDDERKERDFAAAVAKAGIDVAIAVAMVAGVVGTMGGAALTVGAAGIAALSANERADRLSSALGVAVSDAGAIVTKEAVTAAQAEAEQAKIDLAQTVVMSVLDIGVTAVAEHLSTVEQQKVRSLLDQTASRGDGTGSKADALRDELRTAANPRAAAADVLADSSPVKSWEGLPEELRATVFKDPVNARMRADGTPPLKDVVASSKPGYANFEAKSWTANVNPRLLKGAGMTRKQFDNLVEAIYHEARHAFQTKQVAAWRKMRIAEGSLPTETYRFEIPADIDQQIAPMQRGDPMEASAEAWHESQWGGKARERSRVYAEWDQAKIDRDAAKARLDAVPRTATDDERKAAERALRNAQRTLDNKRVAYRLLPEEVDAYGAGQMQGAWARAGLQRQDEIRAAQSLIDSANERIATRSEQLEACRTNGAEQVIVDRVQEQLTQAKADLQSYERQLAVAVSGR